MKLNAFVMVVDDLFSVIHATVTDLDCVTIACLGGVELFDVKPNKTVVLFVFNGFKPLDHGC